MKVLLTGASSFTGFWFARALARAGHHVTAALRRPQDGFAPGVRAERVRLLADHADLYWDMPFGGDGFQALVRGSGFDVLCHHAAEVGDYHSAAFDTLAAAASNTHRADEVLAAFHAGGGKACVITGSVFEAGEGVGEAPLRAFSRYAVSKGLTAQMLAYSCAAIGLPLGKFVVANPFGPFEEARFCAYLVRTWRGGGVAEVRTPDYVRDNLHVRPLAEAYAMFVGHIAGARMAAGGDARLAPSGYVGTQGQFAQRFAAEIGPRLRLEAQVVLARQSDFPEPRVRVNTDPILPLVPGAEDARHWDELAEYYAHA